MGLGRPVADFSIRNIVGRKVLFPLIFDMNWTRLPVSVAISSHVLFIHFSLVLEPFFWCPLETRGGELVG